MTSEPRVLILYHTAGCHLCELAEEQLRPFAATRGWLLQLQDIAGQEALLGRYAVRIPVVRDPARGLELGWPFTVEELARTF